MIFGHATVRHNPFVRIVRLRLKTWAGWWDLSPGVVSPANHVGKREVLARDIDNRER